MRFCLMKKAACPAQHHLAIAAYLRLNEAFLNNSEVNITANRLFRRAFRSLWQKIIRGKDVIRFAF